MHTSIVIKGAREHNLKNIDVTIPRDRLVVITGLSGSGKSSPAFDTIYAEGQRRYVESLSAYARQFLEQMGKPDVDSIEGLSPAMQAETKTGAEADRLWVLAGEEYAAALAIKPDLHEAYNSWAGALLTEVGGKSEAEAGDLIRQAEEHARKAESLVPGVGAYNLTCVEARRGNEDGCRSWLIKSKEFGALPSREHLFTRP
jgi:hypothetical protein